MPLQFLIYCTKVCNAFELGFLFKLQETQLGLVLLFVEEPLLLSDVDLDMAMIGNRQNYSAMANWIAGGKDDHSGKIPFIKVLNERTCPGAARNRYFDTC